MSDNVRLFLKDGITNFQLKCKIIEPIRSIPAFDIAKIHGEFPLIELQDHLKWASSRFAGGTQGSTQNTTGVGSLTKLQGEGDSATAHIADSMAVSRFPSKSS